MAYSMDVRKRVLRAWGAGLDAESVAAKDDVSRAWVHRLVQRQRETGLIALRQQTRFRRRYRTAHLDSWTLGPLDPETLGPFVKPRPGLTSRIRYRD